MAKLCTIIIIVCINNFAPSLCGYTTVFSEIGGDAKPHVPIAQISSLNVDLSQCTCAKVNECELTVLKSHVMDLYCGVEESLCCPLLKSFENSETYFSKARNFDNEPSEGAFRNNDRVQSIASPYFQKLNSVNENTYVVRKVGKRRNCVCKSRTSCPKKYVDYGFGFDCTDTFDTVRCCIPDDDTDEHAKNTLLVNVVYAENATDAEEKRVHIDRGVVMSAFTQGKEDNSITPEIEEGNSTTFEPFPHFSQVAGMKHEISDASLQAEKQRDNSSVSVLEEELGTDDETEAVEGDDGDYLEEEQEECLCLSTQKCQLVGGYDANNMIEQPRDTECPEQFIQCCGTRLMDELSKNRSDIDEYNVAAPTNTEIVQEKAISEEPAFSGFVITNDSALVTTDLASDVGTVPSSLMQDLYPGFRPLGYYYNVPPQYLQNFYPSLQPSSSSSPSANEEVSSYEQPQYQGYGSGEQNYRPWLYTKYTPPASHVLSKPYADARRHKPGGLFDTLIKMLG